MSDEKHEYQDGDFELTEKAYGSYNYRIRPGRMFLLRAGRA